MATGSTTEMFPAGAILPTDRRISVDEYQPDGAIVKGLPRDRLGHHPRPSEIRLIIEIADAPLFTDRTVKSKVYAGAGLPEY